MISLSDIRSPARTVMLSERIIHTNSPSASDINTRCWNLACYVTGNTITTNTAPITGSNTMNAPQYFVFSWPDPTITTSPLPATAVNVPFMAQNLSLAVQNDNTLLRPPHPGIVVMTFCDGHVEAVSDETLCSVYLAAP